MAVPAAGAVELVVEPVAVVEEGAAGVAEAAPAVAPPFAPVAAVGAAVGPDKGAGAVVVAAVESAPVPVPAAPAGARSARALESFRSGRRSVCLQCE